MKLKKKLFQYYVDEGILDEGVLDDFNVGLTSDAVKEIELAKIALETQKAKLDHKLALKKVAAGTDVPPLSNAMSSRKYDTIKHVRMVPLLYEDDVDKYFTMFEKLIVYRGRVSSMLYFYKVHIKVKPKKHTLLCLLKNAKVMTK